MCACSVAHEELAALDAVRNTTFFCAYSSCAECFFCACWGCGRACTPECHRLTADRVHDGHQYSDGMDTAEVLAVVGALLRVGNATYGELTAGEYAAMVRTSSPCTVCGATGDVDPVLHESRFGHEPQSVPAAAGDTPEGER